MILKDVKDVSLGTDCMVYIDINNNLYLVGELGDESYSIEQPKLLDNNVVDFSWVKGFLLWERMDGTIKYMTRIVAPSVISCIANPSSKTYYSLTWERTADFFGGANRSTGYYAGSEVVAGLYLIMP